MKLRKLRRKKAWRPRYRGFVLLAGPDDYYEWVLPMAAASRALIQGEVGFLQGFRFCEPEQVNPS